MIEQVKVVKLWSYQFMLLIKNRNDKHMLSLHLKIISFLCKFLKLLSSKFGFIIWFLLLIAVSNMQIDKVMQLKLAIDPLSIRLKTAKFSFIVAAILVSLNKAAAWQCFCGLAILVLSKSDFFILNDNWVSWAAMHAKL